MKLHAHEVKLIVALLVVIVGGIFLWLIVPLLMAVVTGVILCTLGLFYYLNSRL